MMLSPTLAANPEIVARNLELFAKMIKFETILRNIRIRIESDELSAKRMQKYIEMRENEEDAETHSCLSEAEPHSVNEEVKSSDGASRSGAAQFETRDLRHYSSTYQEREHQKKEV